MSKEYPLVTVVLPAYNAQETIERAIQSVLKSTFKQFEFILMDDGSVDRTCEIMKEYESRDERITVFTHENRGVSYCRNQGIDLAKGKYLCFLDADDEITDCALEEKVNWMEDEQLDWMYHNYEIVGYGCAIKETRNTQFFEQRTVLTMEEKEQLINLCFNGKKGWGLMSNVLGMYRVDVIREHKLRIDESLKYGEDLLFNYEFLHYIKRFGYDPKSYYVVHVVDDSLSAKAMSGTDNQEVFLSLENLAIKRHQYQDPIYKGYQHYFTHKLKNRILKSTERLNLYQSLKSVQQFKKEIQSMPILYQELMDVTKTKQKDQSLLARQKGLILWHYHWISCWYVLKRIQLKIF